MNKKGIAALVFVLLSTGIYLISTQVDSSEFASSKKPKQKAAEIIMDTVEAIPVAPKLLFGIPADSFEVVESQIKRNENLSEILIPHNVSFAAIAELAKNSKEVFDVRRMAANKKITLFFDKDSTRKARYLVYEPNLTEYVVFNLHDSLGAKLHQKEVTVEEKTIYGTINSSLAESVAEAGGSPALTSLLVDVYAWQIDFFRIQKGDWYKVIYEEKSVEGETVGVGRILAVQFGHDGHEFQAFYFDQGSGTDYFDEEGNSLRKAFLKAPLNFTRISSRYSPRRFHPVQKRWKAHLGTDYAAPKGTPIRTVGDGVIVEAGYNGGNGNYVKVRHNGTYTTQYLHMSKIAQGIKSGTRVTQGQTIGYVGSTGLATGPHLCFRFWKNGKQVDALKVELPPSEPIDPKNLNAFEEVKAQYAQKLATIEFPPQPMELQAAL
ncbi:peptidoglycan DD-metalloendopeptidase family protein [Nafulsella turpanensis]|uniref:peptidoglycan DD-metalloendopeptidase family protein n=1 Tax=Nafulsella turpanensis TaxID=1265690 RepID=UPI0003498BFE|nr:peptidoglycan DD-metalloendopeptidase family protein [Nafulsella turpanensis]